MNDDFTDPWAESWHDTRYAWCLSCEELFGMVVDQSRIDSSMCIECVAWWDDNPVVDERPAVRTVWS